MTQVAPKLPSTDEFSDFVDDIGDWMKNYWQRMSGQQHKELAQRFLIWSQQHLTDPELQIWIDSLSAEGLDVLTELLSHFCHNFDIDLAWLVDGKLDNYPELTPDIIQVVVHYCLACRLALDHYEAMQKIRRVDYYQHG